MGTVWKAVQLSTRREVALKLLAEKSFRSKKSRIRFEREVELTARLEHPHIARIYDSGLHQGRYYYAMELIDGYPLDEYLRHNKLNRLQLLQLMLRVCLAVQHAHQRGVIHRDLKPSNIMVSHDGEPHVVDFGLAKTSAEDDSVQDVSIDGELAGTPAYMSPEQAAGRIESLDTRTDVYSLGVILFKLLTGEFPHDLTGSSYDVIRRIAEDEIRRPRAVRKDIDSELESLLLKALSRDPDDRYASAGEYAEDISNYLCGEPLTAQAATTLYFLRKKVKKYRLPVSIAAGVIAVILVAAFFAYTRVVESRTRIAAAQEEVEIQKRAAELALSESAQHKGMAQAAAAKARWAELELLILGKNEKEARAALRALRDEYTANLTQSSSPSQQESKNRISELAGTFNAASINPSTGLPDVGSLLSDDYQSIRPAGDTPANTQNTGVAGRTHKILSVTVSDNTASVLGIISNDGGGAGVAGVADVAGVDSGTEYQALFFANQQGNWRITHSITVPYEPPPATAIAIRATEALSEIDSGVLYCGPDTEDWTRDIYLSDPVNRTRINLTKGRLTAPDWSPPREPVGSPDGRYVVLRQYRRITEGGFKSKIWLLDMQNLALRQVPGDFGMTGWFTWSPDSTAFAFGHNQREILVCDADTLIYNSVVYGEGMPVWSPSGNWIAYIENQGNSRTVRLVSPDGNRQRTVAADLDNAGVCWSPDSQSLAVIVNNRLTVVAMDGTVESQYGPATQVSSWSDDGQYISYDTGSQPLRRLMILSLADGSATEVKMPGDCSNGIWQRGSQLLAFWNLGEEQSLVVVRPDGTAIRKMEKLPRSGFMPPYWIKVSGHPTGEKGPFPIISSRETTYIHGLPKPDGTPDYIAAINQEYSKGVTPENNAAVKLLEAFGPSLLDESIRRRSLDILGVNLPEDGVYFTPHNENLRQDHDNALKGPWRRNNNASLARWLDDNKAALDNIVQASARDQYYFPALTPAEDKSEPMMNVMLPSLNLYKAAGRALIIRANLSIADGRYDDAWRDIMAVHRLGSLLGKGYTLIDRLVGVAIGTIACEATNTLARSENLSASQAISIIRDMNNLAPTPRARSERYMVLDSICYYSKNANSEMLKMFSALGAGGSGDPVEFDPQLFSAIQAGQVDFNPALRMANQYFNELEKLWSKPAYAERRASTGLLETDFFK